MLTEFGPGLWLADGPVVHGAAGFHFPTRMAVIRLEGGRLLLWSPVPPGPHLLTAVRGLGQVMHLVAPNTLHHLFLTPWRHAAVEASIHALPELARKRPDLKIDAALSDLPDPAWAGVLDQVVLRNRIADEVVFFHRPSGTVLFTDLLQGMPPGWFTGWRGIVARLDRMTGAEPAVPRKFRLGFTDRNNLRDGLGKILSWPSSKVVMAHGTPVTVNAGTYLRNAFAWAGI